MKSAHVLVWFRRNLRLHDNAALNAAVASGLPIACVWVSQRPSENHASFSDGLFSQKSYHINNEMLYNNSLSKYDEKLK